ncbi:hemagglutinin repeat-containing protein [Mannheimia pernigra]|uniref:Hemagglutinin repeat-containing protein n=1 Tax=Mannheimia pernigra TaxID=111844 RepID=A0ABD7A7R5_9PAST|nr:hemagglutinin repeat-containing protein [Mannheimia pernigra]
MVAEKGDITLAGTQLVSDGKVKLSAGNNVNITTAKTTQRQDEAGKSHGFGEAVISETERFSGYNRQLNSQNGHAVSHQGSMIASLKDDVEIYAGKDFHSTSGQILAKNRIALSAEKVTFDTAHNTANNHHHSSDLKFGQFTRVISPIIDLVQSVESTLKDKEASDRVKAAQVLGLAAQGYILNNTVNNALNHKDNSVLFRVETGTGLAHSRQSGENRVSESLGNQVNAQHIHIEARSGKLSAIQTDFTSKDEQGKRLANSSVTLSGREGVELLAGESTGYQRHKNQSYGTEVGTALSVGAKTGWSFYAKEGFQKGKQTSESTTYHNSHIDSETFRLNSGGDVTMKGTTAHANSIHADIDGKLHIESLQDSHHSKSTQGGLNTKVEFGFGSSWEFSGNANLSGGKSNAGGVTKQSGLFAQSGGYHITADEVELNAGAIASTNPDNSELTTNAITFSDIQNHSQHQATSGSLSGGYSQSNGVSGSAGMPMHSQGNDNSTTKAMLTEGKITLNKDSTPTQTTAKALGINTELSQAHRAVEQPKDINQVLKEQQTVSQSVGQMAGAANVYASQKAQEAAEVVKRAETELQAAEKEKNLAKIDEKRTAYLEAKAQQESWSEGGSNKRKVDAAVATLGTILGGGSAGQAAVAALSPELNAQIHELTKDSKTANLLAHAALSALEAKVSGTSATAGAIAGAAGEATAMLLAETVFNKQPNELTAEEKNLLKVAGQLAGAVAGQASGGTTADMVFGSETANRAVENNYLFRHEAEELARLSKERDQCLAQGGDCSALQARINELGALDRERNKRLDEACRNKMTAECAKELVTLSSAHSSFKGYSPRENFDHWVDAKFREVSGLHSEMQSQRMENIAKQALMEISVKEPVENAAILRQITVDALKGDETAKEQLRQIGGEIKKAVLSPIDTISENTRAELKQADELEAAGYRDEADLIRMKVYLSNELTAISALSGIAGLAHSGIRNVGKLALKEGVLSNKEVNIEWGKGIQKQGKTWEEYLQKILPEGTLDLNEIKPNFKTFDRLLPDGTAISAKTMDTVGSKTYQDPKRITYQLNRYVDDMVNFKGDGRGKEFITSRDISSREMYLAIPYSTTKQQMEAINKSIDYARSQGVKIIVKEVK